jgi:hypothetical protein
MMKRLTLMMMAAATVFATAQTLCEDRVPPYDQTVAVEFAANKFLSASNYLDYDRQMTRQPLTPAPAGYTPFYLSHYGRHGSRWLIAKDSYTSVVEPMRKAQKYGKLTAKGEEVLAQLEAFFPTTIDRLGDLTTVGERKHHGIDSLPGNLLEAVECLERDPVIVNTLGKHVFEHYAEGKRREWDEYRTRVTDWELKKYMVVY